VAFLFFRIALVLLGVILQRCHSMLCGSVAAPIVWPARTYHKQVSCCKPPQKNKHKTTTTTTTLENNKQQQHCNRPQIRDTSLSIDRGPDFSIFPYFRQPYFFIGFQRCGTSGRANTLGM
jgi:hypothetical protein